MKFRPLLAARAVTQGATGEREGACVSVWMMGKDACGGGALFERAMARFSVLMWC